LKLLGSLSRQALKHEADHCEPHEGGDGQSLLDGSPARFSKGVADRIARARIGSRAADLATVLLGNDPAGDFVRIRAAKDAIPTTVASIFAKGAGLATASQN
jgi:hypothetical protein